jgi:hypothetical protein
VDTLVDTGYGKALGKLTRVTYIRIYFWRMRKFIFPNDLLHHEGRRVS